MNPAESIDGRLPAATCLAHRFLSRATSLAITKADSKIIRDLIVELVSCLLCIDEELVPEEGVQEVLVALENCVEKLGPCVIARTPAAVFVLSGALERHLEGSLRQLALALDQLCEAVSTNGTEAVTLPSALSGERVVLPVLRERSERAAGLAQRVEELQASTDGGAAAFAAVRAALMKEEVAEAEFRELESRSKLASLLFEVGNELEEWLTPSESNFIAAIASALLFSDDKEEPRTPRIDTGNCNSDVGGDRSGASPESSPLSPPSRLVVQKSFLCPIMQRLMRDPVSTASGHTYEREAIESWLAENDTEPCTRQHLASKTLTPNWSLKAAIQEWLTAAGMTYDQYDAMADEYGRVTVARCLQ